MSSELSASDDSDFIDVTPVVRKARRMIGKLKVIILKLLPYNYRVKNALPVPKPAVSPSPCPSPIDITSSDDDVDNYPVS